MAKGILEASLEERAAKMKRPFPAKEAAGTETHRWSGGDMFRCYQELLLGQW